MLSYFLRFCPPARLTEEEECFLLYSPRFGRENAEEEAHQNRRKIIINIFASPEDSSRVT